MQKTVQKVQFVLLQEVDKHVQLVPQVGSLSEDVLLHLASGGHLPPVLSQHFSSFLSSA